MIDFNLKAHYGYEDLLSLVALLRSENGCPWDRVQTHASIRRNFLEEAYEACEGLDRDDPGIMAEEFGDVLLQVVFHTDIERQRGRFSMDEVCDRICQKLVFRHPQLFGGEAEDWETLKKKEKGARTPAELMNGVARSLPALIRSEKLWEKAPTRCPADQAARQVEAVLPALQGGEADGATLGDALLALVDLAQRQELDCETLLQEACERLIASMAEA